MGFVSPRMSIKIWNTGSDPYDHEQLADNWLKVDQHDHSQGRGTPIGSDGIREGAITSVHIYPGAIGADAIGQSAVGTDKIADEAITWEKLDPHVRMPIGAVLDWYWPVPGEWENVLAEGWVVCMGQQLEADEHDFPAPYLGQRYNVPNLIGQVIMGADPDKSVGTISLVGAWDGPKNGAELSPARAAQAALAPGMLGYGGSNNYRRDSHIHNIPGHYHSLAGVTIGGGGDHDHGITGHIDNTGPVNLGSHAHQMPQEYATGGRELVFAVPAHPKNPEIDNIPGQPVGNPYGTAITVKTTSQTDTNRYELRALAATGGIWTGSIGPIGNLQVPAHSHPWGFDVTGAGEHTHTLDGAQIGLAPGSGGKNGDATFGPSSGNLANSGFSNDTDIRVAHVGLLKIMKVRNC